MGATLRIGIITAYLDEDWHSQQLVAAARAHGEVVVIQPELLAVRLTPAGVMIMADQLDLDTLDGYVLARGFGERGNSDFLVPVYQSLERNGKVLVNSIDAVLTAVDKFDTSVRLHRAGVPTPSVVVVQDTVRGHEVLQEWGRVVAKPLYGSLGLGIELLEDTPEGQALLPILLERFGAVYLQEYVPTPDRDIRAFVVGSRVAASMYRIGVPGNWRTNIHQGAHPVPCTLDAATAAMAVDAARAIGLDYTGVDILEGPSGPVVIEVNGNPLWQGLLRATGHDMAEEILAWLVERIAHPTAKGGERVANCTEEGTNDGSRGRSQGRRDRGQKGRRDDPGTLRPPVLRGDRQEGRTESPRLDRRGQASSQASLTRRDRILDATSQPNQGRHHR